MAIRDLVSNTSCYLIPIQNEENHFIKNEEAEIYPPISFVLREEKKETPRVSTKDEISARIRQARLVSETRRCEAEFAEIKKRIEAAEPWPYSRFTDALEGGLRCMRRGATYEAMHAIAKRKVEMARDILSSLQEFPERSICIASELVCQTARPNYERDFDPRFMSHHYGHGDDTSAHFTMGRADEECHSVCVSWHTEGKSWTAKELASKVKAYCELPLVQVRDETEKH